ncbi:hypothetical protein PoB_003598600 [Plakobranchus ocellatus]|uniref:Uncharacterized protein n=1 Tax=Plakobranchus ocellatus TaxID=259542 RepID=A0AAV4ASC9_9GAST|nr:hypothetical protein PoB_003598600 [Plakobranchus ocellatus]
MPSRLTATCRSPSTAPACHLVGVLKSTAPIHPVASGLGWSFVAFLEKHHHTKPCNRGLLGPKPWDHQIKLAQHLLANFVPELNLELLQLASQHFKP